MFKFVKYYQHKFPKLKFTKLKGNTTYVQIIILCSVFLAGPTNPHEDDDHETKR